MLEKITPRVMVLPTATSPKSALELYMVKIGGPGVELPPPQPATAITPPSRVRYSQLILFFIMNSRFRPLAFAATSATLFAQKWPLLEIFVNSDRAWRHSRSKLPNQTKCLRTGLNLTEYVTGW